MGEALFCFGLLAIGFIVGSFEEGIFCRYNLNMYQGMWRFKNTRPFTRDEFNIVLSKKHMYSGRGDYSVKWVKTGEEVLFPATMPGYDCVMSASRGFFTLDKAELFVNEFYLQACSKKIEYEGHTIVKIFKGDANSHPNVVGGEIFYTTLALRERIYAQSLEDVKARIDNLKNR